MQHFSLLPAFIFVIAVSCVIAQQHAEIKVSTTSAFIYSDISVSWSVDVAHSHDWIGLYFVHDTNIQKALWKHETKGQNSGSIDTSVQSPGGVMEYRYYSAKNSSRAILLGTSSPITVLIDRYFLSASPNVTLVHQFDHEKTNDQLFWYLSFYSPSLVNPTSSSFKNDWIGLFRVGDATDGSIEPQWKTMVNEASGTLKVPITEAILSDVNTGIYEFRYYLNNSFVVQTLSQPLVVVKTSSTSPVNHLTSTSNSASVIVARTNIVVGGALVVAWYTANPTPFDWLALYDSKNSSRIFFKTATHGLQSGLAFTVAPAGEPSEIPAAITWRLFNNENKVIAISVNITIHDYNPKCQPSVTSNVKHIIILETENHSFDSFFGHFCTADAGSNPVCTSQGKQCCERAPRHVNSHAATTLTNIENVLHDPNHSFACEVEKANGRSMSNYVQNSSCASPKNFAVADQFTLSTYMKYAEEYAIADSYFQSAAGASSENDMYLARANFVFLDNTWVPKSLGTNCYSNDRKKLYKEPTVADLLIKCNVEFKVFAEGYDFIKKHSSSNSTSHHYCWPLHYEACDIAFQYYSTLVDNPRVMFDLNEYFDSLKENTLPAVSFIRSVGIKSEHPGHLLAAGQAFANKIVHPILSHSLYANNTLILIVQDEGGGYFDHVAPLPTSNIDGMPFSTRLPILAIGNLVKKGHVSHVPMEHSSIVKFLQWNFLGGTGYLNTRDEVSNNIGSLLDEARAGNVPV